MKILISGLIQLSDNFLQVENSGKCDLKQRNQKVEVLNLQPNRQGIRYVTVVSRILFVLYQKLLASRILSGLFFFFESQDVTPTSELKQSTM